MAAESARFFADDCQVSRSELVPFDQAGRQDQVQIRRIDIAIGQDRFFGQRG
jgi:hypothetical protein